MTESSSHIYELLPAEQVALVNQLCDRFEDAWRSSDTPAIEDYLSGAPDSIRKVLVHELILIDATYRQQADSEIDLSESYLQFPSLDQLWLAENLHTLTTSRPRPSLPSSPPHSKRYEIIAEAGRGGMGTVYRARDRRLGRAVCLKSLHPEMGRNPERLARFRREARVVSSLNHPNICTIYELEEQSEAPQLVLEWIEGATFRQLQQQGCDPQRTIDLTLQVAKALRAAHTAGIVHRDIKPENLMVREDGLVKVLDFGLARLTEPEQSGASSNDHQTAEGALLGTAKYMSPEQARGESVTTATDIFSLGIVLYELLTGHHPFPGSYLAAILNAIVEVDPTPAISIKSELNPQLATLVDGMLAKQPEDRPTAAEVIALLGDANRFSPDEAAVTQGALAASQLIVGRESEVRKLSLVCNEVVQGRGSALFISGEPGIGKTTLLESFVGGVVRRQRLVVLHGRCSKRLSASDAYLPILDALARCLDGLEGALVRDTLNSVAPAWAALTASSTDALARFSAESGQLSQGRFKREFRALIDALSQRRPVLFFIDDLHWSDESTVDLVNYLGQDIQKTRLLILGAYRPADSAIGNEPFEQLRRDAVARGWACDIALPLFAQDEINLFLQQQFPAHRFPGAFAELLHERTEGSPLFVDRLVRLLRDRGAIAQAGERWVIAEEPLEIGWELPDSIAKLIDATLSQLPSQDRRLLQAASVQGVEFDAAVVADALKIDRADVEERIQQIERFFGLIRAVNETEFNDGTLTLRYVFVHVLFQEALYAAITPARRASWSLEIAGVLTKLHVKHSKSIALDLAFLYEMGRDFPRAIEYLLQSARHDVMIGANREAADVCRRGLLLVDKLPPSPERDETELQLQFALGFAETYASSYGARQTLDAYERADQLCATQPASKEQFSVLHGLWGYFAVRMEADKLDAVEKRLVKTAEDLKLLEYSYGANTTRVLTFLHQGQLELAEQHLQLAESGYEYSIDDDRRFIEQMCMPFGPAFHTARSWLRQLQGREAEAMAETEIAVALEEELGVPQFQASSWYATLYYMRGDVNRALGWSQKSIEFARQTDFEFYLGVALIIEAWASAVGEQGSREHRMSLVDQVLLIVPERRQNGIRMGSPMMMCMLGEALAKLGRYEEADEALRDSLNFARVQNERWWEAEALRHLGLVQKWGFGDEEQALKRFQEGLELAQRQRAALHEKRCLSDLGKLQRSVDSS